MDDAEALEKMFWAFVFMTALIAFLITLAYREEEKKDPWDRKK